MIDDAHRSDRGRDKLRPTPDRDALAPSETHPVGPMAEPETSPWNVPNALTAFRIVLVPIFAWMLLVHPDEPWWRFFTAVIFSVAILTDTLDGYLARKHNIITRFGKLADPIAELIRFLGVIDRASCLPEIAIRHREPDIGRRKVRIECNSALELLDRAFEPIHRELREQRAALQIGEIGVEVRAARARLFGCCVRQARLERRRDLLRDLVLDAEDIGKRAVEMQRLQLCPGLRIDEARRHAQLLAFALLAALDEVASVQHFASLASVHTPLSHLER